MPGVNTGQFTVDASVADAMRAGLAFLDSHSQNELLARVGETVGELPAVQTIDKQPLQRSYGGGETAPTDDFLVGRGLFYLTEQRRLCLDCTSGHYQMTWGYGHPRLAATIADATEAGVVWDNHSNIPQWPVKALAHRLVESAAWGDDPDPIDTVLLGCCTGSNACAAALKMQLLNFRATRGGDATPAFVVLDGNYHGTDIVAQQLRGMWRGLTTGIEVVSVQPNDADQLRAEFDRLGERAAAFWAEPIMMNREAIPLDSDYLQLARELCDRAGAALCIDEIQTGFWYPEMFAFRRLNLRPDMVIVGKGMTGGFHPQAAVLYKRRFDRLEQYDAISTNGGAALACLVAIEVMDMIAESADTISTVGRRHESNMTKLVEQSSSRLLAARGTGHMIGLKFRDREDALATHARLVEGGLWVRAHAYHEGHSTILTKLGLGADERITDFVHERLSRALQQKA